MERIRVKGTDEYGSFVGFDPIESEIIVLRFCNGWGYQGYHKDKLEFPKSISHIGKIINK